MATIKNAIDNILRATSPRVKTVYLQENANLVQGLKKWTMSGTLWIFDAFLQAPDKNALIIPAGQNFVPAISPYMSLSGGPYMVSFSARCYGTAATRQLTVDLYPDTLPETTITVDSTFKDYSISWYSTHTNLSNCALRFFAGPENAQIEVSNIKLEVGNQRTAWTPNLLDTVSVNNPISPTNYANYMQQGSVSTMAFSQNSSGLTSTGTLSTTLAFDSKAENVLVILSGTFGSNSFATNGECACDISFDIVGGANYLNDIACRAPNMSGNGVKMTWARSVFIASPGAGSKTYRLQVAFTKNGDGAGGFINNIGIQIIGLKR
jgi:hypothetical protein